MVVAVCYTLFTLLTLVTWFKLLTWFTLLTLFSLLNSSMYACMYCQEKLER